MGCIRLRYPMNCHKISTGDGSVCCGRSSLKMGRKGSAKGGGGSFAEPCFEGSVGVWLARRGENGGFLIAFFAFFSTDLIAHNRSPVDSSPAFRNHK